MHDLQSIIQMHVACRDTEHNAMLLKCMKLRCNNEMVIREQTVSYERPGEQQYPTLQVTAYCLHF